MPCWLPMKKGMQLPVDGFAIKEGETIPSKSVILPAVPMILAMENAGTASLRTRKLRAQIKGSGIGTSATRAEILKKLVNIKYSWH